MIGLEDRQALARDIHATHSAGTRLRLADGNVGIDERTLRRWMPHEGPVDRRLKVVRAVPGNALVPAERAQLLAMANEPARIVPMLADEGCYLSRESSYHRALSEYGQNDLRQRANSPTVARPPTTLIAQAPQAGWWWDISYQAANDPGRWFHLWLILDRYSRKILAWEAHDSDDAGYAVHVVRLTALAEGIAAMTVKPALHGENGSTLKATTVLAMIKWLCVRPSCSRPRVSHENAYAESLSRSAKYWPEFPAKGFAALADARTWAAGFARWYNLEHRHSGIRYVTPAQRHAGADSELLSARHELYSRARELHRARWSCKTCKWTPVGTSPTGATSINSRWLHERGDNHLDPHRPRDEGVPFRRSLRPVANPARGV